MSTFPLVIGQIGKRAIRSQSHLGPEIFHFHYHKWQKTSLIIFISKHLQNVIHIYSNQNIGFHVWEILTWTTLFTTDLDESKHVQGDWKFARWTIDELFLPPSPSLAPCSIMALKDMGVKFSTNHEAVHIWLCEMMMRYKCDEKLNLKLALHL